MLNKFGVPTNAMGPEDALEFAKEYPWLIGYLEANQQTSEMRKIANNYWRDSIVEKILYYREHKDELDKLMQEARNRGFVGGGGHMGHGEDAET